MEGQKKGRGEGSTVHTSDIVDTGKGDAGIWKL